MWPGKMFGILDLNFPDFDREEPESRKKTKIKGWYKKCKLLAQHQILYVYLEQVAIDIQYILFRDHVRDGGAEGTEKL